MKTSPFNLEKALQGAPVVTRDGRKVLAIHKFDVDVEQPLIAILYGKNDAYAYNLDGRYKVINENHENDLFMLEPDEKRERLNFGEALESLIRGRYIRRSLWMTNSRLYLFAGDEIRILIGEANHCWFPHHQDLLANDWMIV